MNQSRRIQEQLNYPDALAALALKYPRRLAGWLDSKPGDRVVTASFGGVDLPATVVSVESDAKATVRFDGTPDDAIGGRANDWFFLN